MDIKNYKILITTSGLGQRLGELTKYTNKSLIRIGKKPALSYIVEKYDDNIEIVITLGYYGEHVKDFLELVYPNKKFKFVYVDKYEGEGTSLGYSMLQAKEHLQCPFIYHASDTVVEKKIPEPSYNWTGGYAGNNSDAYSSIIMTDGIVQKINKKGALNFDYLHIGLVGIFDYEEFWKALETEYNRDRNDASLNDCTAINKMIKNNINFKAVGFSNWYDVGNTNNLLEARKYFGGNLPILDKIDESIFIFDENFVVKFFHNKNLAQNRITRAKYLNNLVPAIQGTKNNFYQYEFAKGKLYSRTVTPIDFKNFLQWSKDNLWKEESEVSNEEFNKICYKFYYDKTHERVNKLFNENNIEDQKHTINGEDVPTIKKMMGMIDFEWLSQAKQHQFHGDFILDNIIKTKNGYSLLDWRQDFSGLLRAGDMYYDLAKLNHNLTVNHDIINQDLFTIDIHENIINCDIMRKENLVACQKVFYNFLINENFDVKKIKILTALIWLNMSPLHHHPFNLFLYYFGKLNLWRTIKNLK